ncbi:unnamed protein product, partial [marine sediment metagenome]
PEQFPRHRHLGQLERDVAAIQSMIEQIIITPVEDSFTIDLHGELGAILALIDGKQKRLSSGMLPSP